MTQEVLSRDEASTNQPTYRRQMSRQAANFDHVGETIQTKTRVNRVVFGQELLRIVVIYEERRRRLYRLLVS